MIDIWSAERWICARLRAIVLSLPLFALGACASFSGMPEPFLTAESTAVPARYEPAQALRRYHSANPADRDNMTRRQWRDSVVLIYMAAADARYHEYRLNLSREMRGGNFGLEAATLVLSSAGTVAGESTANALAAAVSALTGARAALSREVYFERTLPALGAAMEVGRLEAATRIFTNLGKSETDYPLQRAIYDAIAYGRAASMDQAIQIVTVEAADQADSQRRIYDNVRYVADAVGEAQLPQLQRVTNRINALLNENKTAEMGQVLSELNISPEGKNLEQQAEAAIEAIVARAAAGTLQAFVDLMRTKHALELDQ